jgi:DNA-binding LacI/PurR family transcriptional regulator
MVKRVTLKDVAERAGVSFQTVSKVLNNQVRASRETEARIWEAVEALQYRPNLLARSMREQRSRLIGYSWAPSHPDLGNPILDQFLQSMAQTASIAGYHILTFPYQPGKRGLDSYGDLIDSRMVDGLVLSSIEFNDPRIQYLQERGFPFVAFGRSNPNWDFPFVDVDGGEGLSLVVNHLVSLGHERIFVLAWPESSRVGQNRLDGLLSALEKNGLALPVERIARGEGFYTFGYETVKQWVALPVEARPTAIIAFNDAMAVGAMNAAQEAGLRVGYDIAITGFDDSPMTRYLDPPLTTIRQPIWEVGQLVISILLSSLDNTPCLDDRVLLPPRLIVRQSTDPSYTLNL